MNPDLSRLAEIANICAGNAASALGRLLDTTLFSEPPRARLLRAGIPLSVLFAADECVAAVFADLDGALPAQAGLLLSAAGVDDVLGRIAGKPIEEAEERSTLSVLAEVGNIAVSAAANALAELLATRALPSVPRAALTHAGPLELADLSRGLPRLRAVIDVEIVERSGPLGLRFVLVPANVDIV